MELEKRESMGAFLDLFSFSKTRIRDSLELI